MSSTIKNIIAPKVLRASTIINLINNSSGIFLSKRKNIPDFKLDVTKVEKCSLIGVLIIYKLVEYTVKTRKFREPEFFSSKAFDHAMERFGFSKLILDFMSRGGVSEREYERLSISVKDDFLIAPHALLKSDEHSIEVLNRKYLPEIEKYYSYNDKVTKMIFQSFSEVFLNFWAHSNDETKSIITASGNKTKIEIACADNGIGIISSLTKAGLTMKKKEETLISAMKKNVTSKRLTDHMGHGLYIIAKMAEKSGGRLHVYSEGAYYKNEYGKILKGTCGFWKGTIIYLELFLKNPVNTEDLDLLDKKNKVQINWG